MVNSIQLISALRKLGCKVFIRHHRWVRTQTEIYDVSDGKVHDGYMLLPMGGIRKAAGPETIGEILFPRGGVTLMEVRFPRRELGKGGHIVLGMGFCSRLDVFQRRKGIDSAVKSFMEKCQQPENQPVQRFVSNALLPQFKLALAQVADAVAGEAC